MSMSACSRAAGRGLLLGRLARLKILVSEPDAEQLIRRYADLKRLKEEEGQS